MTASHTCLPIPLLPSSLPRAEALAEEFPEVEFDIHLMGDLMDCVRDCDVIFAASGSEELLVLKEDLVGMPPASDKVCTAANFRACCCGQVPVATAKVAAGALPVSMRLDAPC